MLLTNLWRSKTYSTSADCAIGKPIVEVDIRAAGLSMLAQSGVIPYDLYMELLTTDKRKRVVYVGKLQANNPEYTKIIQNGIEETRSIIFNLFSIDESEVIAIRNDAVIFISDLAKKGLQYVPGVVSVPGGFRYKDYIEFGIKNNYSSFYKLGRKQLLYGYNRITGQEVFDVAGINSDNLKLHEPYMSDFLKELFLTAETQPIDKSIVLLDKFYRNYISKNLEIGYYRRFDSNSKYDISDVAVNAAFSHYQADFIYDKEAVDISYNAKLLTDLKRIYTHIYFSLI